MRRMVPVLLATVLFSTVAGAAPARRGYTKVVLSHTDGSARVIPAQVSREDNAEAVHRYSTFEVVAVPDERLASFRARAAAHGVRTELRDEFDRIHLPRGTIDSRVGLSPDVPPEGLSAPYPSGAAGLYVVQLVGPAEREWIEQLHAAGMTLLQAVPQNAYVAGGTPKAADGARALAFVQWLDFYHPAFKATPQQDQRDVADVLIEIANLPGHEDTLQALESRTRGRFEVMRYNRDIRVRAEIAAGELPTIVADRYIIGVHSWPRSEPSDERQATSVTPHVDALSGEPLNPAGYASWLAQACGFCGNLHAENFIVGIADTGLDWGSHPSGVSHPDLATPTGRMRFGQVFTTVPDAGEDVISHGTHIAGIIAGDASTGARDLGGAGFFAGMGIAPTAGVRSTKIFGRGGAAQTGDIFGWANDARSTQPSAYIQNHSHNEYYSAVEEFFDGVYSASSRDFDLAVRDANNNTTDGLEAISLTVSSGNQNQQTNNAHRLRTLPPATAKNVIGVGGAENVRDDQEEAFYGCVQTRADGFSNVWQRSKVGTAATSGGYSWNTWIKPDLLAPASLISSTQSVARDHSGYCVHDYLEQEYQIDSGTSWAAPVAAASALLASRVYSEHVSKGFPDAGKASPALLKAMLVGSARSMKGGLDRATNQISPPLVGPIPNPVQGFGRVHLEDIFDTTRKYYFNQTRIFTTSGGQVWQKKLFPNDPTKPVKIVLTWTDAPGIVDTELPVVSPLVNNLHLQVNVPTIDPPPGSIDTFRYAMGNNLTLDEMSRILRRDEYPPDFGADVANNVELVVLPTAAAWPSELRKELTMIVHPAAVNGSAIPNWTGIFEPPEQDFAIYAFNVRPVEKGDSDNDGKADLIWRHASTGQTAIWLMNGNTIVSTASLPTIADLAFKVVGSGDFDGEGHAEILWRHDLTGQNLMWFIDGTTLTSAVPLDAEPDVQWKVAALADLNGDGFDDIVWRHATTGNNRLWLMEGSTRIVSYALPSEPILAWKIATAGDVDGDGKADLVWRNLATGENRIWIMDNAIVRNSTDLFTLPDQAWQIAAAADLNGDNRADVIWRNAGAGFTAIWFMEGTTLTSRWIDSIDPSYQLAGVGDLDNDGHADLVWRNPTTGENRLWRMSNSTILAKETMSAAVDSNWTIVSPR